MKELLGILCLVLHDDFSACPIGTHHLSKCVDGAVFLLKSARKDIMLIMNGREKYITLSRRMEAVAGLISLCGVLADVGTDHGYIPIAMVQQKKVKKAIAMDLRVGPLERAKKHIAEYGLEDLIETRLSDGVAALSPGEADSIVVAGMGGELVMHILSDGEAVCRGAKELILQPQSELAEVRKYLAEEGYCIRQEDMVLDDGKYYPMMRVIPEPADELSEIEALYGPILLREKNPVLFSFLQKEERHFAEILNHLKRQTASEKLDVRIGQLQHKIECNRMAQMRFQ